MQAGQQYWVNPTGTQWYFCGLFVSFYFVWTFFSPPSLLTWLFLFFPELGTEPRALHLLGKRSTTELNPQPQLGYFLFTFQLLFPFPVSRPTSPSPSPSPS
ncbi:rCG63645 [Rattus norvegicus]|uniref:RCG63645 n=1 Tax=Rattus norvegicus TaxID=10116 RepID=A6I0R3_RAT|nr:rCG63645 [Rattus norvegicus]